MKVRFRILRAIMILSLAATFAATREAFAKCTIRPLTVAAEDRKNLSRYSLKGYRNDDAQNSVQALLYTPKAKGGKPLPMVVYIPGSGELGEVSRHFRQPAIFDRVTSSAFQERYPCFLLALTPPCEATTLLGGMPDHPTDMQCALRDFIVGIARMQRSPRVDLDRLYLTGFSYGGSGSYALGQHFPGMFAAVVPIAALPPLPEYVSRDNPGSWWHFHNEGDYARHGIDRRPIDMYAKLVNDAGGGENRAGGPTRCVGQ